MKKKICLIGLNYGKNVLIESIKQINSFNLVGICGLKNRKANELLNYKYYSSWRKMVEEIKPHIVVIAVPPLEQIKIIKFLIKNKIQFLCQKPLANNYNDIQKFLFLKKNFKKKNFIDLNFISIPSIIKFKKIINKININSQTKIEVKWHFKPRSKKLKNSWKNNKNKLGGEINNFFFHLLSVLHFLFKVRKFKLIKKKNSIYYFLLSIKNNNINVVFDPSNNKNLISISLLNKKNIYILENKSKDYHNNFIIKKNEKIIFRKNFPKNKSRINASKTILNLFNKNNKEIKKFTSFEFGLMIQKEIIKLNVT